MASSLPTLATARLLLRPLEVGDALQAQVLFPFWEIVRYMDAVVPWPYPADGALAFFRTVAIPAMERGEAWHWSVRLKEDPEQLIGAINVKCGARENRGLWIGIPWQERGIATEACAAVNDFWFDVLAFPTLRVGKAAANEPSRRISIREGMRLVATEEREFVSGRLPAEVWEISAAEWRARRRLANHPSSS
jgi:RimJ/RimL family protein N-acetyltransferase